MTLYEMTEQARRLYEMLESGEIDEQTYTDTLEAIGADEKVDSYCQIIRQLNADADMCKAEIDRLAEKKRAATAAADRMKTALLDFLRTVEGGKAKTATFSASIRRTQSANITDENAIPTAYRIPQPDKISKADILRDLKSGAEIPGAEIAVSESVIIK